MSFFIGMNHLSYVSGEIHVQTGSCHHDLLCLTPQIEGHRSKFGDNLSELADNLSALAINLSGIDIILSGLALNLSEALLLPNCHFVQELNL